MSVLIPLISVLFGIGFGWGLVPPMEQRWIEDWIEDWLGITSLKERIKKRLPPTSYDCSDLPEMRNGRAFYNRTK